MPGLGPAVGRLPLGAGVGDSLPAEVASRIEASLNVDTSDVRVLADAGAAGTARALGARAFTVGRRVFLGAGERAGDLALMAHEVAHVVQQRGAAAVQRVAGQASGSAETEARQAAAAVAQGAPFTITQTAPPGVQRLGLSDALDYFADKATLIPGYRMFTVVLGVNPINMSRVDRSAANVLRAVVELIPGGALITQALDAYQVFDKVGAWVDQQIRSLGLTGGMIKEAIDRFLGGLGWRDIFDLGGVWDRAKRIFTEPITRLIDFGKSLVSGIITFVKDAILRPLAGLASKTAGWDLLRAVLGKDPITGDPCPRTAETLIGGFMKLIGQQEVWDNIKKANAIPRAWAWFQSALEGLLGFVRQLPSMFIASLKSLELIDIVVLPRAFGKIIGVFGSFAARFLSWAGQQVLKLVEIIFEVLAPSVMVYLRKAMGAFRTIISNPVGFIGNLVRAGVQGFQQFAKNFLAHLRASLIQWLTGSLGGANIYIPQAFEIKEILKFVVSVLGLTWTNVRTKLVKAIGETAVTVLEAGFGIVLTLVNEGPAAAWEQIKEQLSNLREMVIGQVMDFVKERVVQAAITKLVTSLNPAGAFIQAILAIYNTIMFVVERLKQIGQVVAAFIDSIAAIAAGTIGAAANRVEQTMAGLLTLVISFLARIAGLGKVSDAVIKVVDKIRAPIDKALDKVIDWIITMAKKAGKLLAGGDRSKPGGVKGLVADALKGVVLSDAAGARSILTATYEKFRASGLKGIGFAFDPAHPANVALRANASATETIANIPLSKKGLAEALSWAYRFDFQAGTTVLYVYYDLDRKQYGPVIENQGNFEHAEMVFKRLHLSQLKKRITDERSAGKILSPPGTRTPVELDLNRLPCGNCAPILAILNGDPDLRFTVKASSASNTASLEVHVDFIDQLLSGGVEVSTLKIYDEILKKIEKIVQAAKAKQIKPITANEFLQVQAAIPRIRDNIAREQQLAALIEAAKSRRASSVALQKVKPVGSGV